MQTLALLLCEHSTEVKSSGEDLHFAFQTRMLH